MTDEQSTIKYTQSKKEKPSALPTIIKRLIGINLCLIGFVAFIFLGPSPFGREWWGYIFFGTGLLVLICSFILLIAGIVAVFDQNSRRAGIAAIITAPLTFCIPAGGLYLVAMAGAGWGRPLRIRGKQLHPDLCEGSDWTQGLRPDPSGLDEHTRAALEALWLHDAQKEHASVPAFSRISWMLAAVGAPAELMEWAYRSGLEEIEHTRICFALAAGYAGRSHSVEAMPDLLLGGLDMKDDPLVTLAKESLSDGCQLEDFNADVASACANVCEEPATRSVLEQIAREERSHAEFSWTLLAWCLERSPKKVRPAIEKALVEMDKYRRPTAVSWDKMKLVEKANPELMRKHGRLPDTRWQELWDIRLAATKQRLQELLASTALSEKTAA